MASLLTSVDKTTLLAVEILSGVGPATLKLQSIQSGWLEAVTGSGERMAERCGLGFAGLEFSNGATMAAIDEISSCEKNNVAGEDHQCSSCCLWIPWGHRAWSRGPRPWFNC
ncbi:scarecrow-like protein 22 [Pyrus ussuriensis x Pyrus communis]|uniref:Scarecrow-like protein 22 n=1 Tax=Pyrus ussuriensis x Pyrus communis TaxID=2448454 RepID=A0A5N5F8K1_9ROSA|nr:scarecrow-like protein 22 [Pyrus ussuriensis x Pyrus communis]